MFKILNDMQLTENQVIDQIVELLRKTPESINETKNGSSPLHIAVQRNFIELAKLLLRQGISVNVVDGNQQTPLHIAASMGLEKMVLLLGYHPECKFDLVDSRGRSALHLAIAYHHPDCVQNLFHTSRFKLDKTLRDKNNQTAEDILRNIMDISMQSMLDEAFSLSNRFGRTPLHLAVIKNLPEQVRFHLKLGAPVNAQDYQGRTALHLAALCEHSQILLMLCYVDDIDMNCVDEDGNTALHCSIEQLKPDSVKILVKSKKTVNKDIRNNADQTADGLMENVLEVTFKHLLSKESFNEEEVRKWNELKRKAEALKTALSWTPVVKLEKEIFAVFDPVQESNTSLQEYLADNYKELAFSINVPRIRRNSDGHTHKLVKKIRARTSIFHMDSDDHIPLAEKPRHVSIDSGLDGVDMSIRSDFDKAYLRKDTMKAAKIIKNYSMYLNYVPLQGELKKFIRKFGYDKVEDFLLSAIDELQPSLTSEQEAHNKKSGEIQTYLNSLLLARGLKVICQIQDFNQLTSQNYASLSDQKNTIENLQLLVGICSGKQSGNEIIIDPNSILIGSLGVMDQIDPPELIALLIQLHPFFSNMQRLLSNCIVFSVLKTYDFYKFEGRESTLFVQYVTTYLQDCCDNDISNCINEYRKVCEFYKTKSLHFAIDNIKSMLVSSKKEDVIARIQGIIYHDNIGPKLAKTEQDIVFISREFNVLIARFYRDFFLREFRHKGWDNKDSRLNDDLAIFNKMKEFIISIIRNCNTIQQRTNALALFIYVARESLHFQTGADLTTAFLIYCVLNQNIIETMDAYKALEQNDKPAFAIKAELFKLFKPDGSFKLYRYLLTMDERILPSISFLFYDKIHLYEMEPRDIEMIGKIYKSFIVIKKGLQDVNLNSQSDLPELLSKIKILDDSVESSSKIQDEINKFEADSKVLSRKSTSLPNKERVVPLIPKRHSSQRSILEKKPSPRNVTESDPFNKNSLEKKTSPRKHLSDNDHSPRKTSVEKRTSPRAQSADKQIDQETSPRKQFIGRKTSVSIDSSQLDSTPSLSYSGKESPIESPGRLSIFASKPNVKQDDTMAAENALEKEYQ